MDADHLKRLNFSLMYLGLTGLDTLPIMVKLTLSQQAATVFGKTFEARAEDFKDRVFPQQSVDDRLIYKMKYGMARGLGIVITGPDMHPDLLDECLDAARIEIKTAMPTRYILNQPPRPRNLTQKNRATARGDNRDHRTKRPFARSASTSPPANSTNIYWATSGSYYPAGRHTSKS